MAMIIRPNGMTTQIVPQNGKAFSLKELKDSIGGGHFEIIRLPDGDAMVMDEEGAIKGMDANLPATILLMGFGAQLKQPIYGQVLLCNLKEIQ